MSEKLVYSVPEVAKLLGLNRVTVYKLAKQDGFPAVRIGRRIIIPKKALEEWLEREATKKKN